MWKQIFFMFIISSLFVSCSEQNHTNVFLEEVSQLSGPEEKRQYLESIFRDDQKVRGSEGAEIMIKYGDKSKEYDAYVLRRFDQDAINLQKVEAYFEVYGHPDISELGELASATPMTVIHHAQGYDVRVRHFETLYGAYLDGHLDDGDMSFYLGRMYQIKFHKRHEMDGPFNPDDELNTLINLLGLDDQQRRVQASRKEH